MTLDIIEKRIEILLESDKRWPVIVDFPNKNDLQSFLYHFEVGSNKTLSAGVFCEKDGIMKLEELLDYVENNDGNLFIVHLSAYLKLYGEDILKNTLRSIVSKSVKGHVVVVTYQCGKYLGFSDSRFLERGQIYIADGEPDEAPSICMVSSDLIDVYTNVYIGFEKIGEAYENSKEKCVYIATDVKKQMFNMSLVNIVQWKNGYEILCNRDARVKKVPERFGEPDNWNGLLKKMGTQDLPYVVEEQLGPISELAVYARQYPDYPEDKKWLYYIAVSIFGIKKKSYLMHAMSSTNDYKDIPKALFRSILTINKQDEDFRQFYEERKGILRYYGKYLSEVVNFCKHVSEKQEDAIYYLTDLTRPEKEKVFEWLDTYGNNYSVTEIVEILKTVYPDLAAYLSRYRFNDKLLDDYFENYKYQKVINKILPSFEATVEEQAKELGFVSMLKPRTQLFDKVDLLDAHVFFFDALGVEYLGFIQSKCNEYGLSANIICGRCELPSLTCFNKDFVSVCNDRGCPISDIKELDEIKHHGKENFDYQKTKIPIHLIRELEIIDDLLRKIQATLLNGQYKKEIIISDHGSSRLAVLHETENIWEMESKGKHSGRCCPKNEINDKPDFAIEESDYWVLANYDRFKGSRKANVEVHGGATLEEVTVPIIEITRKAENIEAFILEEYKIITLAAKEVPVLRIFAGVISDNITVKVNERYYDAKITENKYIYEIELPDCTKKGSYSAEIINGSEVLSTNNVFEIAKKGLKEVILFD